MSPRLLPVLAGCTALALAPSCSDNPAGPGGARPTAAPYTVELVSYSGEVRFSWGRSADDFYAGSNEILHYDGHRWTPLEVPSVSSSIRGGWNLANGDIAYWNGSRVYRYDGAVWDYVAFPETPRAMCGLPSGEVVMSAYDGVMHHFDGTTWTGAHDLGGGSYVSGMHARTPGSVYAVGQYGLIAHFDGGSWTTTHVDSALYLRDVWSAPDGSVFMTSWLQRFSPLLRDGQLFQRTAGGALLGIDLDGLYADELRGKGEHLYVRGRDATGYALYHFDGHDWSRTEIPANTGALQWGTGDGVVFAGGYNGLWKIADGVGERVLGGGNAQTAAVLWTSSDGDVFAIGEGARMFDGVRWIDLAKQAITDQVPTAVHGTGRDDVWAVGSEMVLHYDGHAWDFVSGAFQRSLRGVWVDGRQVIAVGDAGAIVMFDGDTWSLVDTPVSSQLNAVTGWEDGALAVGDFGTVAGFDGVRWRALTGPGTWDLYAVAALGPDHVVAVGENPWVMLEYRRGTWTWQAIASREGRNNGDWSTALWAQAANDIYIAQYGGDIHHFDGRAWTPLPRVALDGLREMTVGRGGDVFAATEQALFHYHRR